MSEKERLARKAQNSRDYRERHKKRLREEELQRNSTPERKAYHKQRWLEAKAKAAKKEATRLKRNTVARNKYAAEKELNNDN